MTNEKREEATEEFVPETFDIEEVETGLAKRDDSSKDLVLGTQAAHESMMLRAQGLEALRKTTIRALTRNDFHRFGDNHWLNSSGVNKICAIYGINFSEPVFSAPEWGDLPGENEGDEVRKGAYYTIKCKMTARFRMDDRSYTTVGSASTRDPFFGMSKGKLVHPLDVVKENVRKKSETNARAKCLIGLGLANFTPDELTSAGLDVSKSTGHVYKKAAPKGEPTEAQMKMLYAVCNKKVNGIEGAVLVDWVKSEKLSRAQMSNLLDWLSKSDDGAIDYVNDFQKNYNAVIAGKFKDAKPQAVQENAPPVDKTVDVNNEDNLNDDKYL